MMRYGRGTEPQVGVRSPRSSAPKVPIANAAWWNSFLSQISCSVHAVALALRAHSRSARVRAREC